MNDETIYIELFLKNIVETPDAVLLDDGEGPFWVPKSLIKEKPDPEQTGSTLIAEWFAIDNDLV